MGGKAIQNTRRISRAEYYSLQDEMAEHLLTQGYSQVRYIAQIEDKQNFGDLDLLLPLPQRPLGLQSKQVVTNGNITSLEYKDFQVDLIHVEESILHMAAVYFGFNDLGMMLGVLAKGAGCTYGHDGLHYTPSHHSKILITSNPRLIFPFLGVDYSRWLQGFASLEEVFQFVLSSPYCDTEALLSHRYWNHKRRKRNAKRKNWALFEQYMLEHPKVGAPFPDPLEYFGMTV